MEPEKTNSLNFDNIEKVAAFMVMPNGLDFEEKIHELRQKGYDDLEIDIGAKMALQACLLVVFSRTFDAFGTNSWKKPDDPLA